MEVKILYFLHPSKVLFFKKNLKSQNFRTDFQSPCLRQKKKKLYSLYSSYLMRQLFHILIILSNFPIPNSSIHRLTYSKLSSPSKNDHFCNTILISRLYATLFSKEYILHSILSSLSFNTNEGSIPPFF